MNIGNYLRSAMLNEAIGGVDYVADDLEVRLFSTTLTAAGVGTELTGDGYAAQTLTNDTTNFPASTTGTKTNAVAVEFPAATADWLDVLAVGIFDASDNLYFYANLVTPLSNAATYQIIFDIDSLSFTLS